MEVVALSPALTIRLTWIRYAGVLTLVAFRACEAIAAFALEIVRYKGRREDQVLAVGDARLVGANVYLLGAYAAVLANVGTLAWAVADDETFCLQQLTERFALLENLLGDVIC